MDNTVKKPNDMFVATLSKPDATLNELVNSGVNPENTALLSAEEYKSTKLAQKHFTDENGTFHEDKFNEAYIAASNRYKELTDVDFLKNIEKEIEYNQNSLFRPSEGKVKDLAPKLVLIKDPYKEKRGLTGLFSKTPSDLSANELAQMNNVFDPKTGKFTDKSPNDLGLLGTLFSDDTIVYATYDEDGLHQDEETGRMLKHKKGQRKISPDGNFYTEYLGDREIYGKQILSSLDVLTKEDSLFNSVDFFDSDGKTKSAWGTTFKLIAQIAPYTIPGFNTVWGGITASYAMASVLPTFYKSIEGIISGEDDITKQSDLWKFMNKTEGAFSRLSAGKSEEAQNSMFNYEQIGGLVADVFSQIYQQRAVASLSKYAKTNYSVAEAKKIAEFNEKFSDQALRAIAQGKKIDTKKLYKDAVNLDPAMKLIAENQSKLAKSLSLSYMAMTTTGDIYGEAIGAGYDRRTAGIASLLAAGGQYGVMMNNQMGSWFLDKTTGYTEAINRGLMKKSLVKHMAEIDAAVKLMEINKGLGRKGLGKAVSAAKQSIKNTFTNAIDESEVYWKAALIEGAEEVTEEAMLDATKGIIDTMSWLGLTSKKGSFNAVEGVFSKKGFERYVTALVGGAVGGPLFKINEKVIEPLFGKDAVEPEVAESVTHYVANGQVGELINIVNKTRNSLGNKYVSPTTVKIGNADVFMKADGGLKSESDLVADVTIQYLKQLDGMMNQENLKITDENLFKKALLNQYMIPELENSGIDKLISKDFIKLATSYNADKIALNSVAEGTDTSEVAEKVKNKREKLDQLLKGDLSEDYLMKALMLLNKDIHAPFMQLNIGQFTTGKYQQEFSKLPATGLGVTQESVAKEYKEFKESTDIFGKVDTVLDFYKTLQGKFSNPIKDYINLGYGKLRDKMIDDLYFNFKQAKTALTTEESVKNVKNISSILEDSKLPNFTVKDVLNLDVSDYLDSFNAIDYGAFSDETVELNGLTKKIIKDRLDGITATLPIGSFNPEFFEQIFDGLNLNITEEIKNAFITNYLTTNNIAPENIETEVATLLEDPEVVKAIKENSEKYYLKISKQPGLLSRMANPHLFVLLDKLDKDFDTVDPELVKQVVNDFDGVIQEFIPRLSTVFPQIATNSSTIEFSKLAIELEKNDSPETLEKLKQSFKNLNLAEVKIDYLNELLSNYSESYGEESEEWPSIVASAIKQVDQGMSELENIIEEVTTLSAYQEKINSLTKKQLAKENPLYKFLKSYNLEMMGTSANTIFELLEEEDSLLKLTNITEYVRPDITKDDLKSAKNTLEIFKSIITGMYVKQGDNDALFGFNHAMQNFIQKHKLPGKEDYATIAPEEGFFIQKELAHLINKINFLLKVTELGEESKAIEHIKTRTEFNKIAYKLLSEGNFIYKSKPLIANKEDILAADDDTETKVFKLKRALHQSFIDLGITSNYKTFLKEFFNEDLKNPDGLFKQTSFSFKGDMTALSQYDTAIYLLHILAIDPLKLEQSALNIISDDKIQMAPFFGQEYDAAVTQSFINNPKIFNEFDELVVESYNEKYPDSVDHLVKPFLPNLIFNNGIAGSGKTSAVGQNTIKNSNKPTTLVTGPTETKAKNLYDALSKNLTDDEKSKLEIKSKNDIFSLFIDDDFLTEFHDTFTAITNNSNKPAKGSFEKIFTIVEGVATWYLAVDPDKIKLKSISNPPKLIMIDEITHFSPIELDLLTKIAVKHNIIINVFGDTTQNGYMYNGEVFDISHRRLLKTPVLNSSIRSNNNHKADNVTSLRVLTQLLEDKHAELNSSTTKNIKDTPITAFTDLIKDKLFPVTYFENENVFAGDKFISATDFTNVEFKKSVETIVASIKANPTYRLGLITNDGGENKDLREYLLSLGLPESNFKFYSANTLIKENGILKESPNAVQGEEMEFVISLADIQPKAELNAMEFSLLPKTLYTLTSRALIGSVIITGDFKLEDFNIINKLGYAPVNRPLPNDKIISLKLERKEFLTKMLEGQTPIIPKVTTPTKPPISPKLEAVQAILENISDDTAQVLDGIIEEDDKDKLEVENIDNSSPNTAIDDFEEVLNQIETKIEEVSSPSDYTNFLMLHTFYNRTGLAQDNAGHSIFKENENQDLGLLKGLRIGTIIPENDVKDFIILKNSLSLHLSDIEKIKDILKNDLGNKGITSKFELTNDIIDGLTISIINSKYDSVIDNPKYKINYDSNLILKKGQQFSRIAIKFADDAGFLTLGVFPKEDTLKIHLENIKSLGKINDAQIKQTLETFKNLTKKDGVVDVSFEKVLQTSGLRMFKLKNEVAVENLEAVYPGIILEQEYRVFPTDVNEIQDILNKYGYNKLGKVKYPESFLNFAKGRVYTVASVSSDASEENKLIVVLKPKSRKFTELFQEFKDLDVEKSDFNYVLKSLFNKAQGAELYREIIKIVNASLRGLDSFEREAFKHIFTNLIEKQTKPAKRAALQELFALHATPDKIKWENFSFNIGTYILTILKGLTANNVVSIKKFNQIAMDFFYNPVPDLDNDKKIDISFINGRFNLQWLPETPRHVFKIKETATPVTTPVVATKSKVILDDETLFKTLLEEKLAPLYKTATENQIKVLNEIKKIPLIKTQITQTGTSNIVKMFYNNQITSQMISEIKLINTLATEHVSFANEILLNLKCK